MRTRPSSLRIVALVAVSAAALAATPSLAAKKRAPGPNLVANPGFEQSMFEGNPAASPGSLAEPLVPTGWVPEGVGVTHSTQAFKHGGKRCAVISGSYSGGRHICQNGQCADFPTNAAKDATAHVYSLPPSWRTVASMPVRAGTKYLASAWFSWEIITIGKGAEIHVRWFDASGAPLRQTKATQLLATANTSVKLNWKQISGTVVAPAGAATAQLLVGQSDDAWTGSLRIDDAYFGTAP